MEGGSIISTENYFFAHFCYARSLFSDRSSNSLNLQLEMYNSLVEIVTTNVRCEWLVQIPLESFTSLEKY